MENVEIYRDDKIIVEIDGDFNAILQSILVKTVELNRMQYHSLLEDVLKKLTKNNWDYKNCILKASSSVPIIEKNKMISLIEPFNVFEYVFDSFSTMEDRSNIEEIVESLEDFYKELNIPFFINLYAEPLFNVTGVVVAKIDDMLLISFFKIDENDG